MPEMWEIGEHQLLSTIIMYGNLLPKSLTREEFDDWLAGNRADRNDFLDVAIPIEVIRKG